jgi:hypothetical protein
MLTRAGLMCGFYAHLTVGGRRSIDTSGEPCSRGWREDKAMRHSCQETLAAAMIAASGDHYACRQTTCAVARARLRLKPRSHLQHCAWHQPASFRFQKYPPFQPSTSGTVCSGSRHHRADSRAGLAAMWLPDGYIERNAERAGVAGAGEISWRRPQRMPPAASGGDVINPAVWRTD